MVTLITKAQIPTKNPIIFIEKNMVPTNFIVFLGGLFFLLK